MRRLIVAVGACWCLFGNLPATAAARGTIEGRVTNQSTGRPQPGVQITLLTLSSSGGEGEPAIVSARTNADGSFTFDNLNTGEDSVYALDARHDGGLFASPPIQIPDDTERPPVIETNIRVWDTVSDPSVISLRRNDFFVVPDEEGGVGVIEALVIQNDSDLAYIGRGGKDAPSLGIALPATARGEGVSIVDSTLEVPELVATDFGAGTTVAIPPGETRLTLAWRVPGEGGQFDLTRTALYRTGELSVYAGDPLEIRSTRLQQAGSETIRDLTYRVWSSREPIDAGDPVQLLAIADAGISTSLMIGLVAGIGALGAVILGGVLLRGRARSAQEPATDDDLLMAIARLDVEYEAGGLTEERWSSERDRLKSQLRARESS